MLIAMNVSITVLIRASLGIKINLPNQIQWTRFKLFSEVSTECVTDN